MDCQCYEIDFPQQTRTLDQNEEYITLKSGDQQEKLRLHDYCRFYKVPGLPKSTANASRASILALT